MDSRHHGAVGRTVQLRASATDPHFEGPSIDEKWLVSSVVKGRGSEQHVVVDPTGTGRSVVLCNVGASIVATLLLTSLVAATNGLLRSDWRVAVVAAVMAVVHVGVLYLLVGIIRERRRES